VRTLVAGACDPENILHLVNPTEFLEGDFEAEVVRALGCLMPDYLCGVFSGAFVLEGERRVADLALISKNLSHWFVVEVELLGHSLEHHVIPQVRCFRYGEPESSCVTSLVRGFGMLSSSEAQSLIDHVPRHVAVVGNVYDDAWARAFALLDVQYLTVSVYGDRKGRTAHEVEGRLAARAESLGFAQFSAIDNCLRLPNRFGLPSGRIQLVDQFGSLSSWIAHEEDGILWIRRERGPTLIPHGTYVQVIRAFGGQVCLRVPGR
jgi:hypothetical protein